MDYFDLVCKAAVLTFVMTGAFMFLRWYLTLPKPGSTTKTKPVLCWGVIIDCGKEGGIHKIHLTGDNVDNQFEATRIHQQIVDVLNQAEKPPTTTIELSNGNKITIQSKLIIDVHMCQLGVKLVDV